MAIHLRPPVARRLMRPTRGLGSAPFRQAGWSPSYLALLRVELAAFHSGRSRHRHCGAGPRLAADGRYPLPRAVELGLSSRRPVARSARGHPAASLTASFYPGRRTTDGGPPAMTRSMAWLHMA